MKRIYVIAALCALIFSALLLVTCSSPLEPEKNPEPTPPIVDTLYDTTFLTDTLFIHDTTTTTDTVVEVDTIQLSDTVIVVDTLIDIDTLVEVDTMTIYDTTIVVDTLFSVDTLIQVDTVTLVDTLNIYDTTIVVDTLNIYDTTIVVDTLEIHDTTVVVDTVEIVIPDSTCIRTICDKITRDKQTIVWTFGNMAGTYLLTFEGTVEGYQPPERLLVTIDGKEYIWNIKQNRVFTIEANLNENATIKVTDADKCGYTVNVCLTFGEP
jgi:hypothetical protein